METFGLFFTYAMTAIFLENALLTRMLGVSPEAIFPNSLRKVLLQGGALSLITFFSSVISYYINYELYDRRVTSGVRALCFLLAVTAVYLTLWFLARFAGPGAAGLREALPGAAFNCAVLGSLLLASTTQHSFASTIGYGFGAGIGYTLALLLIFIGKQKLDMTALPRAFRGLPGTLLYIGLVSLSIYGLVGHQLPS